ncbi:hypothetical protein [Synechococcus sp. PCC 7336]|uniref:hypothetical protein n=1 Tax=Synechococcus sp. PCC 7336 TaxID=195250 RepID=UPI0003474068|nr:hypothetical protein [Synechococcus sp. PCC 7336]
MTQSCSIQFVLRLVVVTAIATSAWGVSGDRPARSGPIADSSQQDSVLAQLPDPLIQDRPDFFEDGVRQMEEELRRLEEQEPEAVLIIKDELLQWQPLLFRDAGFGIWMPQGVMSEETTTLETSVGSLDFDVVAANLPSSRFLAAYTTVNDVVPPERLENLLAQIREGIIARTDFELVGDRPFKFESYPAREFQLEGNGERMTFHTYVVGKHLYVLAGSQLIRQTETEAVPQFLGSFRLLQ